MYKLAIIIVNYKTADMVIDCVKSLMEQVCKINAKVIIVDNNSNDNSVELINDYIIKSKIDQYVKLIPSLHNNGFSSGNNIGIKSIESEYYLLLNSDTYVRKNAIVNLLLFADSHKEYGLFTPRLEWPDGMPQESCFKFITPVSELLSSSQTKYITSLFNKYIVALPVKNSTSSPEWSSFACVLISRNVFDSIGYLDEGYFMYFEDVEFCHRSKKHGWLILNNPDSHVVHLRGGSSPVKNNAAMKKRLPRYYYESRARYFYQVYGWSGLTLANLLWLLGRVISFSRQILGRKDKSMSAYQWCDIWINWLSPLSHYTHPEKNTKKGGSIDEKT